MKKFLEFFGNYPFITALIMLILSPVFWGLFASTLHVDYTKTFMGGVMLFLAMLTCVLGIATTVMLFIFTVIGVTNILDD